MISEATPLQVNLWVHRHGLYCTWWPGTAVTRSVHSMIVPGKKAQSGFLPNQTYCFISLKVLQAKPWGLNSITDFLWGIVTFFQLFFRRFSILLVHHIICALFHALLIGLYQSSVWLTHRALERERAGHLQTTGTPGVEDLHLGADQEGYSHSPHYI